MKKAKELYLYERLRGEIVSRAVGSPRYVSYLLAELRRAGFDAFVSADPNLAHGPPGPGTEIDVYDVSKPIFTGDM